MCRRRFPPAPIFTLQPTTRGMVLRKNELSGYIEILPKNLASRIQLYI